MCMRLMETLDHHDKLIEVYKVVLRLTNGKFVAMKNHIDARLPEYIYKLGSNTPLKDTIGLHSYQSKEVAIAFAKMMHYYCGMQDMKDVESACVLYCTIPKDSNTKIGCHWSKTQIGYISDKLTVDTTPCKEYVVDHGAKDNQDKWSDMLKELCFCSEE